MRTAALTLCFAALLACIVPASAQLTTARPSGKWSLTNTGQPFAKVIVLEEQGEELVGNYGAIGAISGTIDSGNLLQYNVRWIDARGHGWATFIFDEGYTTFHGRWGLSGANASGSFTAVRYSAVAPPPPITGAWDITVTGPANANARVTIRQKAQTFYGVWSGGEGSGTFPNHDRTMSGTWAAAGKAGTFIITFTADGKGFSGTWGFNNDAQTGQVAGRKV